MVYERKINKNKTLHLHIAIFSLKPVLVTPIYTIIKYNINIKHSCLLTALRIEIIAY